VSIEIGALLLIFMLTSFLSDELMDMPFTLPSLRIDMSSNTSSKSGIGWMEWNHDGTLLGVRNGEVNLCWMTRHHALTFCFP